MSWKEKSLMMVGGGLAALGLMLLIVCGILGGFSGGTLFEENWFSDISSSGESWFPFLRYRGWKPDKADVIGEVYEGTYETNVTADLSNDVYDEITQAFADGEVKKLVIDVDAGEISAQTGDSFQVHYCDSENQISLENGVLYLKVEVNKGQGQLEISLPDGWQYSEVEIKVGAGSANITGLATEKLEADIGMGSAEIIGVKGLQKGEIHTGMGSCIVSLEGNKEDYDYEVKCGMGEIYIDGDRTVSGLGQSAGVSGSTGRKIKIDNGVGYTSLEFEG